MIGSAIRPRHLPFAVIGASIAAMCLAAPALGQKISAGVLPTPDGPHRIGTRVFRWSDPARSEPMTPDPDDPRRVVVQVWYPAAVDGDEPLAPYVPDLDVIATVLDSMEAARLARVETHARLHAEPATGNPRPLVLLSHGSARTRNDYTALAEHLASRGYVVAGIDHPHDAGPVAVTKRRVVTTHPGWEEKALGEVSLSEAFAFRESRLEVWVADASFVLDRLLEDDAAELGETIDSGRVGYVGHSLGGVAATMACATEPRLSACVDLDGWPVHGDVEGRGFEPAYLYVEETRSEPSPPRLSATGVGREVWRAHMAALDLRKALFFGRIEGGAVHARIAGIAHQSVLDEPTLFPDLAPEDAALDPPRALAIVGRVVTRFLDRELKGSPEDRRAETPSEVVVVRYAPGATVGKIPCEGVDAVSRFGDQRETAAAIVALGERIEASPGTGAVAIVAGPRVVWAKAVGSDESVGLEALRGESGDLSGGVRQAERLVARLGGEEARRSEIDVRTDERLRLAIASLADDVARDSLASAVDRLRGELAAIWAPDDTASDER